MIGYAAFFISAFLLASWIDYRTFILPNWLTLPLLGVGIIVNTWGNSAFCTAAEALLGAVLGFGVLRLVDLVYFQIKGQHGIGQGDAKLLAAIGAILGLQAIFPVILIAAVLGLAYAMVMIGLKKIQRQEAIPFGPFLSIAASFFMLVQIGI